VIYDARTQTDKYLSLAGHLATAFFQTFRNRWNKLLSIQNTVLHFKFKQAALHLRKESFADKAPRLVENLFGAAAENFYEHAAPTRKFRKKFSNVKSLSPIKVLFLTVVLLLHKRPRRKKYGCSGEKAHTLIYGRRCEISAFYFLNRVCNRLVKAAAPVA